MSQKVALHIKPPQSISDTPSAMTTLLTDMHKLVQTKSGLTSSDHTISLEVVLLENFIHFYLIAHKDLISIIKPLIFTNYKDAEVTLERPISLNSNEPVHLTSYTLERSKYFPLKTTFPPTEDPYMVLATLISKMEHFSEKAVIQLIIQPTSEPYLKQFIREKFFFIIGTLNNIKRFFEEPFLEKEYIDYYQEVKAKYAPKLFLANLRVASFAQDQVERAENTALITKAFDKLSHGDLNALKSETHTQHVDLFNQRLLARKAMVLNAKEAAALYHFPSQEQNLTNVDYVTTKRIEPPKHVPKSSLLQSQHISTFGITNFRDISIPFGLKRSDRPRHTYIVGKTGMGKSKCIELLAVSDIKQGKGMCVIDPHGDLSRDILKQVPKERIQDVVYFNPSDATAPLGFNPLNCPSPEAKHQVVTGFIAIFKKLFAATWTNRLEHMLRFTLLALVEAGNTTVIDIVRLLTEVKFRHQIIQKIEDPVVKNFWTHEFAAWNEKFDNEAIIPIINQVGQFIANDYIRYVIGQKQSAFDFFEAMKQDKIIVINIAKGKLGEENTALLGSMLITKIQEAAMARVNLKEEERTEFYLYVDEFQHFATESFNQLLSEARKFNVSITVAHQYLNQLTKSIRQTVFGNVGSFVVFRVGPEDAHFLEKEFTPEVKTEDLINLDFRDIYCKLSVDGKTTSPFSATTINTPSVTTNYIQDIVSHNRSRYGKSRQSVLKAMQQSGDAIRFVATQEPAQVSPPETIFEEPIV